MDSRGQIGAAAASLNLLHLGAHRGMGDDVDGVSGYCMVSPLGVEFQEELGEAVGLDLSQTERGGGKWVGTCADPSVAGPRAPCPQDRGVDLGVQGA